MSEPFNFDRISIQDDENDRIQARYWIVQDAYNRDKEANNPNCDVTRNEITLDEIMKMHPAITDIFFFSQHIQGMAREESPKIEIIGNIEDNTIRITDFGRNFYEEFLKEIENAKRENRPVPKYMEKEW